jgi:hypothetical protein
MRTLWVQLGAKVLRATAEKYIFSDLNSSVNGSERSLFSSFIGKKIR